MADIHIPSKIEELLQAECGFQVVSEWNPCEFADDEISGHFEGASVSHHACSNLLHFIPSHQIANTYVATTHPSRICHLPFL